MTTSTNLVQTGSHRKAESTWQPRVTKWQEDTITTVFTPLVNEVTETMRQELVTYVATGDLTTLTTTTYNLVVKVVAQVKEHAPNESQAKRIWPRKVAAVICQRLDLAFGVEVTAAARKVTL